jgi:hypothetical protein
LSLSLKLSSSLSDVEKLRGHDSSNLPFAPIKADQRGQATNSGRHRQQWSKETAMRNKSGKSLVKMLALALSIVCTQFAVAQTFKHVNVKGGVPLVQIAPGGASVWARAANGNPYIFKTNKFVPATSIVLTQLAVGGGNALQEDTVWGAGFVRPHLQGCQKRNIMGLLTSSRAP